MLLYPYLTHLRHQLPFCKCSICMLMNVTGYFVACRRLYAFSSEVMVLNLYVSVGLDDIVAYRNLCEFSADFEIEVVLCTICIGKI